MANNEDGEASPWMVPSTGRLAILAVFLSVQIVNDEDEESSSPNVLSDTRISLGFCQYILSIGPVDLKRTYPSCRDPSGTNLPVNRAWQPLHISALRAPFMGLPLGPVGAFPEPGPLSYCRSVACVGI